MIIQVLTKVGALFFMLAVGAVARARKVITDEALDSLCKIVLSVTLPFLFIYVLSTKCNKEVFLSLWKAPLFAVLIIGVGYVISRILGALLKLNRKRKNTFTFLISFQNSGFFAIPIAFALFGEEGVLTIVIFNLGFNLLYWTLGVWLLSGKDSSGGVNAIKNLINPGTVALGLGLILGLSSVRVPHLLLDASRILGNATIPLALLVVGAILATGKFRQGGDLKEISSIVLARLVLIPLIFLGLAKCFGDISPLMRSIIVLQACMPSASSSPLMAKRFGGDYDLAASGVFFTTLFSIITIPIFMSLV